MSKNTSTISKIDLKIMQTNKGLKKKIYIYIISESDAPVGIFDS